MKLNARDRISFKIKTSIERNSKIVVYPHSCTLTFTSANVQGIKVG